MQVSCLNCRHWTALGAGFGACELTRTEVRTDVVLPCYSHTQAIAECIDGVKPGVLYTRGATFACTQYERHA